MKLLTLLLLSSLLSSNPGFSQSSLEDKFIKYIIDPKKQDFRFFYKDEKNQAYRSIQQLKTSLEKKGEKLLFAMNGGMYMEGNIPLGIYRIRKNYTCTQHSFRFRQFLYETKRCFLYYIRWKSGYHYHPLL